MSELLFYGGVTAASVSLIAFIASAILFLRKSDQQTPNSRIISMILLPALAAAILLNSGLAFIGFSRMEQLQSAFAFVEYSSNAFNKGDTEAAVSYALQALPEKQNIFMAPYTPVAKKALADALGVYKLSDAFKPHAAFTLPSEPLQLNISPDCKTAAAVYPHEVMVFDIESSQVKAALPMAGYALADAVFLDNSRLAFAGESGISVYDMETNTILWSGKPATSVAVSQKGDIAIVFMDNNETTVYDAGGQVKVTLSFAGKKLRTAPNDSFVDANDNIFTLNEEGNLLVISFSDGSLALFDLYNSENSYEILHPSDFIRFDGGFFHNYLAISASQTATSSIAVLDLEASDQTVGFRVDKHNIVTTDKTGIYISSENLLEKLDPVTGDRQEIASYESGIRAFARDDRYMLVTTVDSNFLLFNADYKLLDKRLSNYISDFVQLAGEYAILGSRGSPELQILKLDKYAEAEMFSYDPAFKHDDARINAERTRVLLYSKKNFQLHNINGGLINETEIPDSGFITDIQYSKKSGNLVVTYTDALRIYSGNDGSLKFEEAGLRSVFYAPYGVSVLDKEGMLNLIDIDTASPQLIADEKEGFAAYCGMVVDSALLEGRELIAAVEVNGGYVFVISDGTTGSVYNEKGKRMYNVPAEGKCHVFFTDSSIIISPLHGPPSAYSLQSGKLVGSLEQDSVLTDIKQIDDYLVCTYRSDGDRHGVLLDTGYNQLADLPDLTDISDNTLIFDCDGSLRQSRLYTIDELIDMAKEQLGE